MRLGRRGFSLTPVDCLSRTGGVRQQHRYSYSYSCKYPDHTGNLRGDTFELRCHRYSCVCKSRRWYLWCSQCVRFQR